MVRNVRELRWGAVVLILAGMLGGCGRGAPEVKSRVTIASSPESGADVMIRGVSYGQTPVVIEGFRPGPVLVVVTKEGYKRAAKLITVPSAGSERIVVDLEPLLGYITVESKPTGAQVFLDGVEYLGDTPLVYKPVVVGTHTYEIRKENYKTLSAPMEIQQDYRYTFAHELTPKEARLSVFSRPSGAKIWLNDELRPQTTPAKFDLPPGDYSVQVHAKGYIMSEEALALAPNEERSLEFALRPGDAPPGMVLVPAGRFLMGLNGASPDERPQRDVDLEAFYIDRCEVTNADFKAVFPQHTFPKGHELYPVTGVSFKQATEYAQAVGKRLPTEAEWEKAARGVDGREYPWANEFHQDWCNSKVPGVESAARVAQFRLGASPYGCMDMAGNAYEWTSDWYQAYPGNTDVKKEYGQIFRVLRGGSFKSDRFGVRCARRYYDRMDAAREDYGFRCVKDIGSSP
jgi:formylglycine-generating enzyme required for sulfatase activity